MCEAPQAAASRRCRPIIATQLHGDDYLRPAGVYGDPEGMLMRRVKAGEGGSTAATSLVNSHPLRDDIYRAWIAVICLLRDQRGEKWCHP